ncbi:MAG: hypothetical protein ACI89X_000162 [Planctomycetota bacterium]
MHAPYAKTALFAICLLTKAIAQGPTTAPSQPVVSPLQGDTYTRDLEVLNQRDRASAEQIHARLQSLGTDLHLVAVIPRLQNRYGCFADVDGDGDLDYLSTEMTNRKEQVRLHRNGDTGWRHGSSRGEGVDKKHPLIPWFLENDGTGSRAMVVPTRVAPYLVMLRLNPRGDFRGKAVSLQGYLPRRLSRARGTSNSPYTIEACESATEFRPARIIGRLTDENDRSRQDVRFALTLLEDGTVEVEVKQVAPGPTINRIFKDITVVKSPSACEHESSERESIVTSHVADVNGDGIDDLVVFSGVLSAHVFPGVLKDGKAAFGKELNFGDQSGHGRDLPIEDLRIWFPVVLRAGPKELPYAHAARAQLARIGFRVESERRHDAVFSIRTERRKGWFLNYYAVNDGLVPVQDYRSWWPHKQDHHPMIEEYRASVVIDADHDRSPDILSVHVGQQFEWLRPPPKERGMLPDRHIRKVDAGRLRCGIVHGLGERHDDANRVLVQFEDDVKLPKDPSDGYPISVTKVPVHDGSGIVSRWRYCVHVRPRQLGFIFEIAPVDPVVAKKRQFLAWTRRADRRLEMQPHYWACDTEVCRASEQLHLEVFADAVALFKKALPLAGNARDKGSVWRHIARCHGRSGDLDAAKRAYERFVMIAKVVESLDAPHADLRGLFADESFLALHRGWCKKWPVIATSML